MIYLDHAAAAPLLPEALEAMLPWMTKGFANAGGAYAAGREACAAADEAREKIAALLGARPEEIYFTSGGSESDNWAVRGTASANEKKRHILTDGIEHHALLNPCALLEKQGWSVTCLPADEDALIHPEQVEAALRPDTALVSVMLANNEIGTIQPIAEIAEKAHAAGAVMHTDAVQAVGHIPVNARKLGVDLLSVSAHKFGGPKGVGVLYIRRGIRIDPLILGGAQEKGMRAGTENIPGIVGMAAALEVSCGRMEKEAVQVSALAERLVSGLNRCIPGIRFEGRDCPHLPGIVHCSIPGQDSSMLLLRLDLAGIAASAGSACASGSLERSHVLVNMGRPAYGEADLRFSLGADNTQEEIDETVRALSGIVNGASI